MKVYKITFWKCFKPSINIIVALFLYLGFMGLLMSALHYRDGQVPVSLILLTIFLVLFFCAPNVILHLSYIKEDRKKELSIDFINKKVTLLRYGNKKLFFLKDVVKVVRISVSSRESNICNSTAPWRHFYYYRIELQDGSSLFLTSFLVQNLEKVLPSLKYEHLHRGFPIVTSS